ncbi:hypothetical protein Kpol_1027p22 [Vanderwaltozyma polyspora DSM 70294]|uniref:Large ribosomal subunit protein bL17m C-terminal fungi domain-containing protein n=1 Tax=Vanderwaltozyma polyspora (strain ATCC 22028 / DSM 70294 / BCRC 21397 / CBS 2163 / NBRC 10782 / NRRL Y-8283 / UCD 57-17) TaxID=436907 RepID=A7TQM6_VANPO|nr:uncharacterized protein Kpol_1027p22 [Vanderwaltozyma polyspora DSM 70294]EDO15447.1 hypothetical protein Kpol_1027p22 [Vanderwaltozyma polyspora DSM 70294]
MTQGLARKLSRDKPHRDALLKNLVSELFSHGSIISTHEKCKEASRLAERIITWSKIDIAENKNRRGIKNSHEKQNIQSKLFLSGDNSKLLKKLYTYLAPIYSKRTSGFTRVLHLPPRENDSARQSVLELVDYPTSTTDGQLQRGNLKLWLLCKTTLLDESLGNDYAQLTLKNLHKQTLFKSKDEFINEIKSIRSYLSPNQESKDDDALNNLIDKIYSFKQTSPELNEQLLGYKILDKRPERS